MPKLKECEGTIPALYRYRFMEACSLGWLLCSKHYMPAVSLEKTILGFFDEFGLTVDDIEPETLLSNFYRMKNLIDAEKEEDRNDNT